MTNLWKDYSLQFQRRKPSLSFILPNMTGSPDRSAVWMAVYGTITAVPIDAPTTAALARAEDRR
jgi:hypothetical protein